MDMEEINQLWKVFKIIQKPECAELFYIVSQNDFESASSITLISLWKLHASFNTSSFK